MSGSYSFPGAYGAYGGEIGLFNGINVIETPMINGVLLLGGQLYVGTVPDEPPIYAQVCKDLNLKPLPDCEERRPALRTTGGMTYIKET